MRNTLIYSTICLLSVSSCTKDKVDDNLFPEFTGITSRSLDGTTISFDQSDWNFRDQWSELEHSLFLERYANVCPPERGNFTIQLYPNPVQYVFALQMWISDTVDIEFRIVDKNFNVVMTESIDTVANQFKRTYDLSHIRRPKEVFRMYYKIYGRNCELRGHGDILIQ